MSEDGLLNDNNSLITDSLTTDSRKKRLLKKAPDAPKRFKSAYICYVMDRMDEIKKTLSNDAKVTDIMKILAKQWKSLPPLEKQKYEDYAQVDKSRYFNEMSHYSGPMQVPNKRQKKPPGAPKRAMSAFLSYSQVMRPTIRAQQPNLKNSDISSVLASQWRTASNEEKQPHIEKELKDREKYHHDMLLWKEEEELNRISKTNHKLFNKNIQLSTIPTTLLTTIPTNLSNQSITQSNKHLSSSDSQPSWNDFENFMPSITSNSSIYPPQQQSNKFNHYLLNDLNEMNYYINDNLDFDDITYSNTTSNLNSNSSSYVSSSSNSSMINNTGGYVNSHNKTNSGRNYNHSSNSTTTSNTTSNSSNSTISSTNNKIKSSLTSGPLHRSHNHIQQPASQHINYNIHNDNNFNNAHTTNVNTNYYSFPKDYGGDSRPNVTEAESKSYDMSMYNPYDYMIPYTDQYYINPSNRSNTINKSKIYDKTNDNLEKSKSVRFNNDSMSKLLTTKKTQKNITNGLSNNSNNSSIYIKKQIKPKKSSPVERSAEELEKDSDYSKVIRTLKAIKQAHMSGYSDDSNSSIDDDKK